MQPPIIPEDEAIRLVALESLRVLDSAPEERFDRLTRLACRLFGTQIAAVSLIDSERQWFKSIQGLDATETSRDVSFCGHAILCREIMVVRDALLDERFHDNPLVVGEPHIRFYAGCPISGPTGHQVGTLCVIDPAPREFDENDRASLRDLARMVEDELVLQEMAISDPLTGLCNRRGFEAIATNTLANCRRLGYSATLAYFDVDGLKRTNDSLGHAAGDRLLEEFSMILSESFRTSDVIARLGGDEFCALLSGTGVVKADSPLRRLRLKVARRNERYPELPPLQFSFGLTSFDPRHHGGVDDLIQEADARMYEQKRAHHAAATERARTDDGDDVAA